MRILKVIPFINKRNNQISITLPRRKLKMLKKGLPKLLKIKIEEMEW